MSWVCHYCSSNNDDENEECFVCGAKKADEADFIKAEKERLAAIKAAEDARKAEEEARKAEEEARKAEARKEAYRRRVETRRRNALKRAEEERARLAEETRRAKEAEDARRFAEAEAARAATYREKRKNNFKFVLFLLVFTVAFVYGQVRTYIDYATLGYVAYLSDILEAAGASFDLLIYLIFASVFSCAAYLISIFAIRNVVYYEDFPSKYFWFVAVSLWVALAGGPMILPVLMLPFVTVILVKRRTFRKMSVTMLVLTIVCTAALTVVSIVL